MVISQSLIKLVKVEVWRGLSAHLLSSVNQLSSGFNNLLRQSDLCSFKLDACARQTDQSNACTTNDDVNIERRYFIFHNHFAGEYTKRMRRLSDQILINNRTCCPSPAVNLQAPINLSFKIKSNHFHFLTLNSLMCILPLPLPSLWCFCLPLQESQCWGCSGKHNLI